MLHTLGLLPGPKAGEAAQEMQSAGFSFSITNDYPDKIIDGAGQFGMIGKRGQQGIYSISALNLNGSDAKILNNAKAKLVDALVSGEELPYSIESTRKVQQLALNLLNDTNTHEKKELLAYLLAHETVGYGPISILLEDGKNIEEIIVNSPTSNICVYHSIHGFCTTNMRFNSERDFRYMINKTIRAVEREINSSAPIIDAQLCDGSRVHAQLRPYSINGAAASIRLNGSKSMDLRRLMDFGTATPELLAYLWLAIETNHNIIISGAPASGKTSFLLALNAFVPRYQRVITIEEDVNELKFYSNFMNSVSLQGSTVLGRATTRDQVINALHLRPDRLIVGEIRGSETNEMLSGSNYGVPFMTTMHSSGNGQAVISRLQAKPMGVEPQILTMLDVSVFMRQEGLMSRKVDSVLEYRWLSRDEISVEELDTGSGMKMFESCKDGLLDEKALEGSKVINAYMKTHLLSRAQCKKELKKRVEYLKDMPPSKDGGSVPDYIANYWTIR